MLDWLLTTVFPSFATIAAQGVEFLISYNNNIIEILFKNDAVINFLEFVLVIGSILYVTGIALSFANWAIDTNDGKNSIILDTFKNTFIGLGALLSYTTIPILFLRFTNYICELLCQGLRNIALSKEVETLVSEGIDTSKLFTLNSKFFVFIYIIILFVCVCKLFLANIKRGGILLTLIFVGSFHMFSIPRGYLDSFWSWCKQVIGVCITAFIQNFLVALAFLFLSIGGTADLTSLIISAGVALSASEAPRILQQFGLDTSMRANVSQAIFAVSGITNIRASLKRAPARV